MRGLGWVVSSVLLIMTSACGDESVTTSATQGGSASASTGASSTGAGSSSTGPGSSSASGSSGSLSDGETSAPGSSSGDPTTGDSSGSTSVDPTGASASTTGDSTTSTSGDPTTSTSGDPTTSTSGSTSSTSGGGQPPPPPALPEGCEFCECCDPWPIAWQPSPGATHYVVRWKCSINPEQVIDVGAMTMVKDVCNDINMCNGMCAFTVGYIKVEACNENGCSTPIDIPAAEIPISCGGGCCC